MPCAVGISRVPLNFISAITVTMESIDFRHAQLFDFQKQFRVRNFKRSHEAQCDVCHCHFCSWPLKHAILFIGTPRMEIDFSLCSGSPA
jgi:hypothetical protein